MRITPSTRRRFLVSGSALLAMPFVRGAAAAGALSVGLWDHWVPGANAVSRRLIEEWAARERVDVSIDYITSQGSKLALTLAAEAQARVGHDIVAMTTWAPHDYARRLLPVDDVMQGLATQNGQIPEVLSYLASTEGRWIAVPATIGSQIQAPCSRIDLMKQHAGIDVQALYPPGEAPRAESWTLEAFIRAAEACHKANVPFGIGLGTTADSVGSTGAWFHAFGASLADATGTITVRSDSVREALTFCKRLARFLPSDAPAWDDASNNRWLVSGRGALILNPPSAWAVAKRDAPHIASQLWTHGMPAGPKGRFVPFIPFFWGIWEFSRNKDAAKSLLLHLSRPESIEKLVSASAGYDLPPFSRFTTLKAWAEAAPPTGTLYHYPNPHDHQTLSIAAAPAPPRIARQIFVQGLMTKMVVRHLHGEAIELTLAWAEGELEGMMRG